jgi:hypothetical protein
MISETPEIKVIEVPAEPPIYIVYPRRFYVLFVFSFLAFNQCLIWLTFSPIARNAEQYYGISEATVDLLLNWGPIIFIPCLPLTSLLLNRPNGLRHCVILLALTDFLAALSRILPSIILKSTDPKFNTVALPFIHIGQILNAACGPLVMAPVAQLSCLWFAPHERTRATTVAIFSNNFGAAIGFVISPFIVALPGHVPRLLYVHFGLAFVACVLALLYFPSQPPSAPSAAAELLINNPTSAESSHSGRAYLRDLWTCFTTPAFLLLSGAGGLLYGTFGAWTSLYDVLLEPEGYSEVDAGKKRDEFSIIMKIRMF